MRVDKKEILRMELKKLGSHQEIAKAIGVSRPSVSRLVNKNSIEDNDYTSLNVLRKISEYYKKDLTWLASGDGKWN